MNICSGIGKITKLHCFATNFTSISCSSETTKEGKSTHFLRALLRTNSKINDLRARAIEVIKIFGTKVSYFMMQYELTKNECFLSSFSGDG